MWLVMTGKIEDYLDENGNRDTRPRHAHDTPTTPTTRPRHGHDTTTTRPAYMSTTRPRHVHDLLIIKWSKQGGVKQATS